MRDFTDYGFLKGTTFKEVTAEQVLDDIDSNRYTDLVTIINNVSNQSAKFYFYITDDDSWQSLCGSQGYFIINGDKIIYQWVTIYN